jgi:hypothetical protein
MVRTGPACLNRISALIIGSLPCLGCRAERLQVEVGLTRRVAIKTRMRPSAVIKVEISTDRSSSSHVAKCRAAKGRFHIGGRAGEDGGDIPITNRNTVIQFARERHYCVNGAVARLVGIEVGVVSGVFNLESPGVSALGWRLRHEEAYHAA